MSKGEIDSISLVLSKLSPESLPIILIVIAFGWFFIRFQRDNKTDVTDFVTKPEMQVQLLLLKNELIERFRDGKTT